LAVFCSIKDLINRPEEIITYHRGMLQSLKVWKGDLTNHILEIRSLWQDSFELHYTLKVQDQTKMAGLLIHVEEDCLLPLCRVLVGLDFLGAYKYIHLFFSTIPYDLAG